MEEHNCLCYRNEEYIILMSHYFCFFAYFSLSTCFHLASVMSATIKVFFAQNTAECLLFSESKEGNGEKIELSYYAKSL